MSDDLFSVRMRASQYGDHLSGAERLVRAAQAEAVAAQLVGRALHHEKGAADRIQVTLEWLAPGEIDSARLPDLRTIRVDDFRQGRCAALQLLKKTGVAPRAAEAAMTSLAAGAAPGGRSMRGAMLVDAASGARLEKDQARGVRASRMDLSASAECVLRKGLARLGLDNLHVREALVLAGKVITTPGIIAELCWSDDPSYIAGYVASPQLGYVRLTHLKPVGEPCGGRAFFVRSEALDLQKLIAHLEQRVVLFDQVGRLEGEISWGDFDG